MYHKVFRLFIVLIWQSKSAATCLRFNTNTQNLVASILQCRSSCQFSLSHKSETVAHNTPIDSVALIWALKFQTVIDMYIFSPTLRKLAFSNSDRWGGDWEVYLQEQYLTAAIHCNNFWTIVTWGAFPEGKMAGVWTWHSHPTSVEAKNE
jgi:hypothetical protein